MTRKVKIRVRDLHAHVTCYLCDGYFIDATTIIECLHSFCRTCIVRYLSEHKSCPVCHCQVHKTRPLLNIRHDQALQDIVYTLVPGLRDDEMRRRRLFWEDNKDRVWEHLSPEDLGETDRSAWRKSSQKVCLSIEPTKIPCRELTSGEWTEIPKPLKKRYIRCCHDVTILHLHKFLRMKLKEDDEIEIIIFYGDNVLSQNYTLEDIIDTFSSSLNQTLKLTFAAYAPKYLNRKPTPQPAIEAPPITAQRKRRLPSATPQLKAFFNSQMTPKSMKLPLPPKEKKPKFEVAHELAKPEQKAAQSEEWKKKKHLELLQLKTIEKPCQQTKDIKPEADESSVMKPEGRGTSDHSAKQQHVNHKVDIAANASSKLDKTIDQLKKAENRKTLDGSNPVAESDFKQGIIGRKGLSNGRGADSHLRDKSVPMQNFIALSSHKPPIEPSRIQKPLESQQCYTMLTIPVDEAVRSKPPTPVESPTHVFSTRVKRNPEPTRPFVQHKSVSQQIDLKQQRNRRKPVNPTHHAQFEIPRLPGSDPGPAALVPRPEPIKSRYETVRIPGPQRTGQFILLTTQASSPGLGLPAAKPDPCRPPKTAQQKQYEKLSNAQAHRVALDAVRNTMGKIILPSSDKRPVAPKRPILPKTNSISVVVPANVTPTRNIFKNEPTTYPMTSQSSKQAVAPAPSRGVKAMPSTRKSDIEQVKELRHQQLILSQMAAAVNTRKEKKKILESPSPRNGPPPPYHAVGSKSAITATSRSVPGPVMTSRGSFVALPTNQNAPHIPSPNKFSVRSPPTNQLSSRSPVTNHVPARSPIANQHSNRGPISNPTPGRNQTTNLSALNSSVSNRILAPNSPVNGPRHSQVMPSNSPANQRRPSFNQMIAQSPAPTSNQSRAAMQNQHFVRNIPANHVPPRSLPANRISSRNQSSIARQMTSNQNLVTHGRGSTPHQNNSRFHSSANQNISRTSLNSHSSPRTVALNQTLIHNISSYQNSRVVPANQEPPRQNIPAAVKDIISGSRSKTNKRKPNILRKSPISPIATPPGRDQEPLVHQGVSPTQPDPGLRIHAPREAAQAPHAPSRPPAPPPLTRRFTATGRKRHAP